MMWTTKPKPKKGDIRALWRFAILPVACSDGTTRWLERVVLHQCYEHIRPGMEGVVRPATWNTYRVDAIKGTVRV